MTPDYRTELELAVHELEIAENALLCSSFHYPATRAKSAARRIRTALAAEPQAPTDEALLLLAAKAIGYERIATDDCDLSIDAAELIAFARAVLARYGTPRPIPVTERLPGASDCDAEGQCWWFVAETEETLAIWMFSEDAVDRGAPPATHWLPAYALLLPEATI
jgi:hypothetical protein